MLALGEHGEDDVGAVDGLGNAAGRRDSPGPGSGNCLGVEIEPGGRVDACSVERMTAKFMPLADPSSKETSRES